MPGKFGLYHGCWIYYVTLWILGHASGGVSFAWLRKQLTWFDSLSVGQHLKCQFSSLILRMLGFLPTRMWFVIQLEIWAILRQDIIKMRHSSNAIPLYQVLTSTQNLPALGSTSASLVFFPPEFIVVTYDKVNPSGAYWVTLEAESRIIFQVCHLVDSWIINLKDQNEVKDSS